MKFIRNIIIGVLILALIGFTAVFILNAYNTGKIGNKAEKVADTFTEDLHKDLKADYILANPPFNLEWDRDKVENDPRWHWKLPSKKELKVFMNELNITEEEIEECKKFI